MYTLTNNPEHLHHLSILEKVGWWEFDQTQGELIFSKEISLLLGFDSEQMALAKFVGLVDEECRKKVLDFFSVSNGPGIIEWNLLITTPKDRFLVRLRYDSALLQSGDKIVGSLKILQAGEDYAIDGNAVSSVHQFLGRNQSISRSLRVFMEDNDLDKVIHKVLEEIRCSFHADRVFIFEFDADDRVQRCIYEVVSAGTASVKDMLHQVKTNETKWLLNEILSDRSIILDSLDMLPDQAKQERTILQGLSAKSLMAVPLRDAEKIWGYIALEMVSHTHKWSKEDTSCFYSLANIISICVSLRKSKDDLVKERTEMKKTSMELENSKSLLNNIFSIIPVGVEVYDCEGNLMDLNNKDMELFGIIDKESAIGHNISERTYLPKELREWIKLKDHFIFSYDYSSGDVDQQTVPSDREKIANISTKVCKLYDSEGEYQGVVLVHIDNTEKLLSMSRIREFEHFFSLISGYAKVGYSKLNILTGEGYAIKQWYKNMAESEDTPLTEIVGRYANMHPDDRKYLLDFFDKLKKHEANYFQKEVRILKPGTLNEWTWLRMHVILNIYQPENNLIEVISVSYDITELKEIEFNLVEAKERAEAADLLKTAFIANMSHEIRTPLNAIVGFSNLLVEINNEEEKRQFQHVIEENSEQLLKIVANILDLSKIETDKFEFSYTTFDFNMLCQNVIQTLQPKVSPTVEVFFKPEFVAYELTSDYARLQQVLLNLFDNAIKFTSQGSISISYSLLPDAYLRVSVEDTGIGMAAGKLQYAFERFTKLNTFAPGSGLGLSICKSIVEQLGGTIGVDSKLGEGSCFWFTIPLYGHK